MIAVFWKHLVVISSCLRLLLLVFIEEGWVDPFSFEIQALKIPWDTSPYVREWSAVETWRIKIGNHSREDSTPTLALA